MESFAGVVSWHRVNGLKFSTNGALETRTIFNGLFNDPLSRVGAGGCKRKNHAIKRRFTLSDLTNITSDIPTLLGVSTGIAVLAGLICMVLHLFSKTKYPRSRHFADAHSGPPVMFASDTGEKASMRTKTADEIKFISLRDPIDNTIESTIIEIKPTFIRLNWLIHRTAIIRCTVFQRSRRFAVPSRCGSFSRHIAILISFEHSKRPKAIPSIPTAVPFKRAHGQIH
jgi:hypothetical protein